ncbi:MAG: hypothetical protein WBA76_17015 [Phormidesmis sp.]
MLNRLLAAISLSLLSFTIAPTFSLVLAQSTESGLPNLPTPSVLPQVQETTGRWSIPSSAPPNVIDLPGVSQADIERLSDRPKPRASSQPSPAAEPPSFQYRYIHKRPVYQGVRVQTPTAVTTCSYSFSPSNSNAQTFSLLPIGGNRDNNLVVTERTVTERTFVLNNGTRAQYAQLLSSLGNSNLRRGANRLARPQACEAGL